MRSSGSVRLMRASRYLKLTRMVCVAVAAESASPTVPKRGGRLFQGRSGGLYFKKRNGFILVQQAGFAGSLFYEVQLYEAQTRRLQGAAGSPAALIAYFTSVETTVSSRSSWYGDPLFGMPGVCFQQYPDSDDAEAVAR
jgi:hypothetical protein